MSSAHRVPRCTSVSTPLSTKRGTPLRSSRSRRCRAPACQCLAPGVSIKQVGEPNLSTGKVRLDVALSGEYTQAAYDEVVEGIKQDAPDIPGFPKKKGGKGVNTALVPTSTIVMMLGKKNIVGFTVEKVVSETLKDFVDEQGLSTGSDEIKCTEERKDLVKKFKEGAEFTFQADITLSADELEEGGLTV